MEILKQTSETREDLGLLAVMEALEDRQRITQRELATETGLNLKKVNHCLHNLLGKGFVKFQRVLNNPDKRAYLYILTPAGVKAKSQLTYQFLKFTLDFYNRMEGKLRRCLDQMIEAGVEKVILYGASDVARILLDLIGDANIEVVGVVDDGYDGHEFHGISVLKASQLRSATWDGVLITSVDNFEVAEKCLISLGVKKEGVWVLS